MTNSTVTFPIPVSVKAKFDELAARTGRARSDMAAEAIADYVGRELGVVQSIECGLEDMRAGRVIAHDDVMAEIRRIVSSGKCEPRSDCDG